MNAVNQGELGAVCKLVRAEANLRGVVFFLHTPHYGHDDLELETGAREGDLNELLTLRRRYPVLNSPAGLHAALRDDWAPPCPCALCTRRAWSTSAAGTRATRSSAGTAGT